MDASSGVSAKNEREPYLPPTSQRQFYLVIGKLCVVRIEMNQLHDVNCVHEKGKAIDSVTPVGERCVDDR